jgi:DNA polymerase-1
LKNASDIPGKLGQNIQNNEELALLSKELVTINCNVPVECTLEDIAFTPVYSSEVRAKLGELEITSLANRMSFDSVQEDVPQAKKIEKNIVKLTSANEIENAVKGDKIAVLIGRDVSFAVDDKTEYTVSCVEDLFSEGIVFDDAIATLKEVAKGRELICYDYKNLSKTYGFDQDKFFDVMIAAHLARGSAPIKSLEQVLGADGYEIGAVELFDESQQLRAQLAQQGLNKLFFDIEQPLCVVLRNMEERGVRVSTDVLKALEKKYGEIIEGLTKEIYSLAGETFNIASPKQLGDILFDKLGLPHGKKTKTGYSVSEDVLSNLAPKHPIVNAVLEYRHYAKLQSTYVMGLQPLVNRGRIHTEFNQCITQTGRLSSTNPNLQNIPARSDEAKDIKSAFIPGENCVLVSADYSQIELRLLAHMSGDEQLIEAFNHDDDIHAITASQILGIPVSEVTPQQRRDAKAVNFGIIYGISGYGLAENLSIPQYMAKEFIANYFTMHPKVREFMDKNVEDARARGYSLTMSGRRRNLPDLKASNYMVRSAAERMAMNTPLQGSAADIIKIAMINVEKRLENMKSKMILQIHDELIIEATKDEEEEVKKILSYEMEHAVSLSVPLVAEATSADNWGDLK